MILHRDARWGLLAERHQLSHSLLYERLNDFPALKHDGYELLFEVNDNQSFPRNSPKMIRRPTDQNRRPCLLLCPEEVATGSRPAERPPTPKQQVRDTQMWHKYTLTERETMRPPLPITHLTTHKGVIMCFCACVCGRRRHGAWTGYSAAAPGGHRAAEKRLPLRTGWVRLGCTDRSRWTLCSSVTRGRVRDGEESKYVLLWVDSWQGGWREIRRQRGGVR